MCFAAYYTWQLSHIKIESEGLHDSTRLVNENHVDPNKVNEKIYDISKAITEGAETFLYREYVYMAWFMLGFGGVLLCALGFGNNWTAAIFTTISFLVGAITSIICGYVGMKIAVYSNSRTAIQATKGNGCTPFSCSFSVFLLTSSKHFFPGR